MSYWHDLVNLVPHVPHFRKNNLEDSCLFPGFVCKSVNTGNSLNYCNSLISLKVLIKVHYSFKDYVFVSQCCLYKNVQSNYPCLPKYNYHMKCFWIFVTFCDVLWNKWPWTCRTCAGFHGYDLLWVSSLHSEQQVGKTVAQCWSLTWKSCIQSAVCSQSFRWHSVKVP